MQSATLRLTLLAVDGRPARDAATRVGIRPAAGGPALVRTVVAFPPSRAFVLPAYPRAHALTGDVAPARFRARRFGPFTLTDGEVLDRQLVVFRRPAAWRARFDRWRTLDHGAGTLAALLDASPGLRVKGGRRFDRFAAGAYDAVPDTETVTVHAKACLLNLHAKLTTVTDPVGGRAPWFRFLRRILEIGRERLIAVVDDEMLDRVRTISRRIEAFPVYERTPARHHHRYLPTAYTVARQRMVSVRTGEAQGCLQLTLAPAVDPHGAAVTLLDADIDENGTLIRHLFDLFRHRFTGGTHPYDVHEYLRLEDRSRRLWYDLT